MKVRDYIAAFTFTGGVIAGSFAVAGQSQAAVVHRQPVCRTELAAYRVVSRQAGLRIGSTGLPWNESTSPRTWARELRASGDYPLGGAAAAIHGPRSADQFVMALTASAAAALEHSGCR